MSKGNPRYIIGKAGILGGLIWMALALTAISGVEQVFEGAVWDYLGVLAAASILAVAVALYLQDNRNILGTTVLALGSISLSLSALFYALALDPQDGNAFLFYLLGTIVQGLGIALVGYRFRSLGTHPGIGMALSVLGIVLVLTFPAWLILDVGIGLKITELVGDQIWGTIMLVQAISWIVVSRSLSAGGRQAGYQSLESAG